MSIISLFLLCFITQTHATSAPEAWSATSGSTTLTVFTDDTYTVYLNSTFALLTSGLSAFHLNNSWFVAPSPSSSLPVPSASCTNLTDTDCHGDDLYYFNTTSVGECCDNCSATDDCKAWTFTGETLKNSPPYWANRCYIKASCAGKGGYVGHTSGIKPSPSNTLARVGAGGVSGTHPSLGSYTGWEIQYTADGGGGGSPPIPITTTFLFFPTPGVFLFNTTFPAGVSGGMNLLTPGGGGGGGEFSASQQPSTQFPVFDVTPSARFLTWGGRFFGEVSGSWGGGNTGGAEGGPIVLYRPQSASTTFPAISLAPFNYAKSNMFGPPLQGQPGTLAAGLNGYVPSVPMAFSLSTSMVASDVGITDVMHKWGAMLLNSRGTVRKPDPLSLSLSYWTDNGAYFDFYAYEPSINSAGVPQDILEALAETFRNGTYDPPLPVQSFMLDAWWMYNVRDNGNCKMNDTAWPLPLPRGLASLSAKVGPLIIYNGPMCGNTTYASQYPLELSLYWDQGWGKGVLSAIAANSSLDFYRNTFASLKAQGMGSFTQDFLDFQSLLFPGFLMDVEGNAGWMRGQAMAAEEAGIAVQYCMGLPNDVVQSADFPAVTNARASQDYGAGGQNWRIGGSSLLLSAVGMLASKDNFWTGPANDRGHETSPYLVAAVAVLGGGPVGFADPLYGTNPSVLWPTCTANGTILHPSRPATYIDAHFSGVEEFGDWGVTVTHNSLGVGGLMAYSILVDKNSTGVPGALQLTDLWPVPKVIPGTTAPGPTPRLFLWAFNSSGCTTQGGDAGVCVVELGVGGGTAPLPPPAPNGDAVPWGLWNAVPLLQNGYTLLGEMDKYVANSPFRFRDVRSESSGVGVDLSGSPGETVHLGYVTPAGKVMTKDVVLDGQGMLTTTLA